MAADHARPQAKGKSPTWLAEKNSHTIDGSAAGGMYIRHGEYVQ
jgi:hypothetical protein